MTWVIRKYFRQCCVCLALLMTTQVLWAATEIVERTVTSYGETRESAVVNALIEAISQIKGINVESRKNLESRFEEILVESDTESHESFTASSELQQQILSEASGYVKSYEIINLERNIDSPGWTAVVFAQIPKYVPTGQDRSKMRTLVVLPFRTSDESYPLGDGRFPADEISWQLNHKLISELTQSRKFRLLDREYLEEHQGEIDVLKTGEVPVEETLRLGQRLGSDFMIVGVITDYKITEREKETLGIVKMERSASINFEYRVIEVAPQEIRWSGSVEMSLGHPMLRELTSSDDLIHVQNAFLAENAAMVASEVLEVIFPIKVLSIQEGQVTLNQGGIRVEKGQLFDVFTPGQKVVDPDTRRKIRLDGPWVGTLEVVSVRPKFSIARMIEGDIEQVKLRAICRKKAAEEKATEAPATTTNW